MKLVRISVQDVAGLPDGMYSATDRSSGRVLDVVLVTGGPASGKTALLEAIAAAAEAVRSGALGMPVARVLRRGAERARIEATWVLTADEVERGGLREAVQVTRVEIGPRGAQAQCHPGLRSVWLGAGRKPASAALEYFPDNRQLGADGPQSAPLGSPPRAPRPRAGREPDKYATLLGGVLEAALAGALETAAAVESRGVLLRGEAPDPLAGLKAAVAALVPRLRLLGVHGRGGAAELQFERVEGAELSLDELSAFERQGVLFGLAFVSLGLEHAVVLLDTPELHIHPSEQARWLRALGGLGGDNQLIVATSAAALLREASPSQVIELPSR
jgi:hypothetical protein